MRRNKLLGQWIAEEFLGRSGAEVESYAKEVVAADFEEPGDADLLRKIFGDLEKQGVELSEHRLRKKMDELTDQAKQQIMTE